MKNLIQISPDISIHKQNAHSIIALGKMLFTSLHNTDGEDTYKCFMGTDALLPHVKEISYWITKIIFQVAAMYWQLKIFLPYTTKCVTINFYYYQPKATKGAIS